MRSGVPPLPRLKEGTTNARQQQRGPAQQARWASGAEISTSDGTAYAHFSLSTTYRFRGTEGRERLGTTWTRIAAFGDVALSLRGLGMGSWLMATGRLRQAVGRRPASRPKENP